MHVARRFKPIGPADPIDGRRREHRLQVRFGETDVTGRAIAAPAHGLRERTLYAGAGGLLVFNIFWGLAPPRGVQGKMLGLG